MIRSMQALVFILIISIGCKSTGHGKHRGASGKGSEDAENIAAATPNGTADIQIAISTSHEVSLYKQIHAGCVIDIFFTKGMVARNVLADPYFSWLKALNLNSLQYSGGSPSDHEHVIINDTLINGGKGDGYNIRRSDVEARGESYEGILDGVATVKFGVDFFNQYCALLHKLNVRGDVAANVQSGTLPELYWKIKRANAQRVIFGMEQNLTSNAHVFPDGTSYRKKISQWIDSVEHKFPGIITVVDAAPVHKQTAKFATWNSQLKGIQGDEARLYLWDKDILDSKDDAAVSMAEINQAFSQTIPHWFDIFKSTFPGKRVSVCQWGIKAKSSIHNNMTGCLYIGKFYEFMIRYNKANDNLIGYACFMSLKSLNRGDGGKGDADNFYKTLKNCGLLFTGNKKVDDIEITGFNGVSGVGCSENGNYALLLINETGSEVNLAGIKINGASTTGKIFTMNSVSASSLDSYDVKEAVNKGSAVSLKPYSVNVITF